MKATLEFNLPLESKLHYLHYHGTAYNEVILALQKDILELVMKEGIDNIPCNKVLSMINDKLRKNNVEVLSDY